MLSLDDQLRSPLSGNQGCWECVDSRGHMCYCLTSSLPDPEGGGGGVEGGGVGVEGGGIGVE